MPKESILYGVIGLLAGSLMTIVVATTAVNNNMNSMMRIMGMGSHVDQDMGMNEMSEQLRGKLGDEFDKAFIAQMIVHHQGAIDMANLAKQSAKHDEIKKMADDIISAQSREIEQMKQWQKDWGYPAHDASMGGMH